MKEYMEAVGVFSLSLLAASAAFLFDPASLITALAFLPVTAALGFVIYISDEGFEEASLAAFPTVLLGLADPRVGAAALFLAVAAPVASLFAGGRRFRDHFASASVPVLAAGLVLGFAAFGYIQFQPEVGEEAVNLTAEQAAEKTDTVVSSSDMFGNLRSAQLQLVESTSEASVALTGAYVENASLDQQEQLEVAQQIQTAQEEVPETISSRAVEKSSLENASIREPVRDSVRELLRGRMALLAIPIVAGAAYTLRPLIALLSAIFAYLFQRILG